MTDALFSQLTELKNIFTQFVRQIVTETISRTKLVHYIDDNHLSQFGLIEEMIRRSQ